MKLIMEKLHHNLSLHLRQAKFITDNSLIQETDKVLFCKHSILLGSSKPNSI